MDPDELADVFRERPALHRYPGSMAGRVQEVCRIVAEDYGGQGRRHLEGRRAAATELVARLPRPARVRRAEGQDLRRAARQAAGRAPRGLAARSPPPTASDGTYLSVADITDPESLAKVRATKKAMKAKARRARRGVTGGRPLGSPPLSLHAGPARPGRVPRGLHRRRRGRRPAARQGARRQAADGPGPPGRAPSAASTACPSSSTTGPTWRSRWAPTASTSGRTTPRSRWRGASWGPTPSSGLSTHGPSRTSRRRRARTSPTSRPGRWRRRRPSPAAPGTGLGYVTLASARSSVPVFVTGGVTPEKIPALAAAGVRHFVVVRYLTRAPDARRAARALREAIDRALSSDRRPREPHGAGSAPEARTRPEPVAAFVLLPSRRVRRRQVPVAQPGRPATCKVHDHAEGRRTLLRSCPSLGRCGPRLERSPGAPGRGRSHRPTGIPTVPGSTGCMAR